MKTVTLKKYICDYCGSYYSDEEDAKRCEAFHEKDLQICGAQYTSMIYSDNKMPDAISIKTHEGNVGIYKLVSTKEINA